MPARKSRNFIRRPVNFPDAVTQTTDGHVSCLAGPCLRRHTTGIELRAFFNRFTQEQTRAMRASQKSDNLFIFNVLARFGPESRIC
jgi:hypothetical protein